MSSLRWPSSDFKPLIGLCQKILELTENLIDNNSTCTGASYLREDYQNVGQDAVLHYLDDCSLGHEDTDDFSRDVIGKRFARVKIFYSE